MEGLSYHLDYFTTFRGLRLIDAAESVPKDLGTQSSTRVPWSLKLNNNNQITNNIKTSHPNSIQRYT